MADFGVDIIEHILLGLEAKSLIRCKAVCKMWNHIIEEPQFVKKHLNYCIEADKINEKFHQRRIMMSISPTSSFNESQIIGSVNGLVCIFNDASNPFQILLVNPSTREVKQLETPIFRNDTSFYWGFGLAGDEDDDYKVTLAGFDMDTGGMSCFEVLDVKSNIWKSVPIERYKYAVIYSSRRGIYCDNQKKSLNWFINNHLDAEEVVLSFDLAKEEFKEIRPPYDDVYEYDRDFSLGILGNNLCIKGYEDGRGSKPLFWVLKDEVWEMVDPPGYDSANYLKSCKNFLACHGPMLDDDLWYSCNGEYVDAPIFVPSILSPNVVEKKLKEFEISEQDPHSMRNLLRIAIFNISCIRGLFPEIYFSNKGVPAIEMDIKELMPMDAESRILIDWIDKGVHDALQKRYLKTLMFCVCETVEGPMIEEYAFSISYTDSDSLELSMNFNHIESKKQGGTFMCNSTTPSQMKSSACKMICTLIQLMRTLDKMPEEHTILMKLLYDDNVTPADYEPPLFRGCTDEETHNTWTRPISELEVGIANCKSFILSLKVKSHIDPCEDDNVRLGADSSQQDGDSELIASLDSYATGMEKGRYGNVNQDDQMDTLGFRGRSRIDKRSRKASTVKEPILRCMKHKKFSDV